MMGKQNEKRIFKRVIGIFLSLILTTLTFSFIKGFGELIEGQSPYIIVFYGLITVIVVFELGIFLREALELIIQKEVKVKMDYQSELQRLKEGSNYWKPKVGQFTVKALTELEEADPFVQRRSDGTEERHEQAKVKVSVNGEEKIWTFGKGKTPASTFGQLVEFASKNNNTLKDKEFKVVVKSDGTKNDYTIVA